jgi:hypothetical protein
MGSGRVFVLPYRVGFTVVMLSASARPFCSKEATTNTIVIVVGVLLVSRNRHRAVSVRAGFTFTRRGAPCRLGLAAGEVDRTFRPSAALAAVPRVQPCSIYY